MCPKKHRPVMDGLIVQSLLDLGAGERNTVRETKTKAMAKVKQTKKDMHQCGCVP